MTLDKDDVKEAIQEWLDEKFATVGRWSFYGILAFMLAGLTYTIFWVNGWRHNP
jgi:hypothetical protein